MTDKNIDKKGRVVYVEPNNFNSHGFSNGGDNIIPHPYEDYAMSVDLTIEIPDRNMCGMPENFGGRYNSGTYKFSSGRGTIGFMNGDGKYLTTSYTDISSSNVGKGNSECIGIQSLNIRYTSWQYPQVSAKFIDIRGAALMLPEEEAYYKQLASEQDPLKPSGNLNGTKIEGGSFFKSLFSFPYPRFILKVKGFYGKEVTYTLSISSCKCSFNCDSGNFEVDVEFIGYMYGVYSDLPMNFIAIAPYMDYVGLDYWNKNKENGRFSYKGKKTKPNSLDADIEDRILTFMEFQNRVKSVSKEFDKAFKEKKEYKDYEKKKKAHNALKTVSFPLMTAGPEDVNQWHIYKKDDDKTFKPYYYRISAKGDTFEKGYAEIRASLQTFIDQVKKINTSYEENIPVCDEMTDKKIWEEGKLPSLFVELNRKDDTKTYVISKTTGDMPSSFPSLIEAFPELSSIVDKNGKTSIIADSYATLKIYKLPARDNYSAKVREKMIELDKWLNEATKRITDLKTEGVQKALKFTPSIRNIFNMAFAHMETFLAAYYSCLREVDSQKTTRTNGKWKISSIVTDLNTTDDNAPIPPFPLLAKKDANGNNVAAWPCEVLPEEITENMPEVKLVYSMLNATKLLARQMQKADESIIATSQANKPTVNAVIPTTLSDFICLSEDVSYNPYEEVAGDVTRDDIEKEIMLAYALRSYQYFLLHRKCNTEDLKMFGEVEALNFYKSIQGRNLTKIITKFLRPCKNKPDTITNTILSTKLNNCVNGVDKNGNFGLAYGNSIKYNWCINKGNVCLPLSTADSIELSEFFLNPTDISEKKFGYVIYPEGNFADIAHNTNTKTFKILPNGNFFDIIGEGYDWGLGVSSEEEKKYKKSIFESSIKYSSGDQYQKAFPYRESTFIDPSKGKETKYNFAKMALLEYGHEVDIDKYQIKYPAMYNKVGKTTYSIYGDNLFYAQNQHTDSKIKNQSKAYLFLFSQPIRGNAFAMGKSNMFYNGAYLYSQLLREGAYYWRKETIENTNIDPIITVKGASPDKDEIFSTTPANEYWYDMDANSDAGQYFNVTALKENYQKWNAETGFRTNISADRVKNLKNLFIEWANSTEKDGFLAINSYFELVGMDGMPKTSLNIKDMLDTLSHGANPIVTEKDWKYEKARVYAKPKKTDFDNNEGCIKNLTANTAVKEKLNASARGAQEAMVGFLEKVCNVVDFAALNNGTISYTEITDGVAKESIRTSFDSFINKLYVLTDAEPKPNKPSEETKIIRDDFESNDMRLSLYMTLKTLYDKWFCGCSFDRWKLNINHKPGDGSDSDFDCFCYYDTFYRDISDKLIVGPSSVANIVQKLCPLATTGGETEVNLSRTIFEYLAEVTQKCNAMMLALPVSFGMKDANGIQNMFDATSFYNRVSDDKNSYVVMYAYQPSQALNNDDPNALKDDGFDIADTLGSIKDVLPAALSTTEESDGVIPAFGVTYAKQNQSYFKSISLNMDSPTVTEYSIAALMNISSKASQAPRETTLYGQDLYRVYSNYAYSCQVQMMGCAQITPLMYFQLNNVPMWKGAYIVTKVSHDIAAGSMTTSFEGVRLCKNSIPLSNGEIIIPDELGNLLDIELETLSAGTVSAITDASKMAKELTNGRGMDRINDTHEYCGSLVKTITVKIRNLEGTTQDFKITVNKALVAQVTEIFNKIYTETTFRINPKRTGSYCYRTINNPYSPGTKKLSYHSYGAAIDINWDENGFILPDGKPDDNTHVRTSNHPVVKIFKSAGWGWGGNYKSKKKDYMHFSPFGGA